MRVIGVPWHFEPDGNGDWRKVYDVVQEEITDEKTAEEVILLDTNCYNNRLYHRVHSSCSDGVCVNGIA